RGPRDARRGVCTIKSCNHQGHQEHQDNRCCLPSCSLCPWWLQLRTQAMRILFLGDIVGKPGVVFVKRALPVVVARERIDLVIANAENATDGSGLSVKDYRQLRQAGVDLVTLG